MKNLAIIALLAVGVSAAQAGDKKSEPKTNAPNALLEQVRAQYKLPALAAVVVKGDRIVARGAVGVRRTGSSTPVTADDQFHIGSCTKSMTATLAAMFVEQGKLGWKTTIAEAFPELKAEMHPQYRVVTLEQLLGHRAGIARDAEKIVPGLWKEIWNQKGTPTEQRLFVVCSVVTRPPEAEPGTRYTYSNFGYSIAGAMLERVGKDSWENLMRKMLFEPLGMRSAGFGAPGTPGREDQPWGHQMIGGQIKAIAPGPSPGPDNPAGIGPGGIVHCSLDDLARYALFHMRGARGEGSLLSGEGHLLKPESFRRLHTPPPGQKYALGWGIAERPWAKGVALTHTGSNNMWHAVVWIAPQAEFAVVVATNAGGPGVEGDKGCDQAAWGLIQQYLLKP